MVPDLVYDIGMWDGGDTAYYLHRGYRVVAVEANPELADAGRERFAEAIRSGRLALIECGVGPDAGVSEFWINHTSTGWSSFDRRAGCRAGGGHPIPVRCRPLREILAEHGVPLYLKIDIEGNDIHCLRDLSPEDLPRYVSVEAHALEYLALLSAHGYNAFKCVNQRNHNDPYLQRMPNGSPWAPFWYRLERMPALRRRIAARLPRLMPSRSAPPASQGEAGEGWVFPPGSSGPFGEDAPGEWQSLEETAYNWLLHHRGETRRGTLYKRGWYDFHATRR